MKKLILITLAIVALSNVGYAVSSVSKSPVTAEGEIQGSTALASSGFTPCGLSRSYVKQAPVTDTNNVLPPSKGITLVASNGGFQSGR